MGQSHSSHLEHGLRILLTLSSKKPLSGPETKGSRKFMSHTYCRVTANDIEKCSLSTVKGKKNNSLPRSIQ